MPALDNPRHERFAQELAKGKSQGEAYVEAGYKPDYGAASRLSGNVKVQARVAELLERGAVRAEVTVQSILDELEEARQLAKQLGQTAAAVSASMGKAKVRGLIIDKKETGAPGDFDRMDDDELADFIKREAIASGLSLEGEADSGRSSDLRGKSGRVH